MQQVSPFQYQVYKENYNSTDSGKISILKSVMTRLPPKLISPKNQIAGALFVRGGDNPTESVFGVSVRRFYRWETGYYLKYSYRYVEGTCDRGFDYYHWHSEYHLFSLGVEGFRTGNIQTGGSYFFEMGMTSGVVSESLRYKGPTYKHGPGVAGVIGARIWSNLIFGELQLSYNTMNDHLIPSVVAGYRF